MEQTEDFRETQNEATFEWKIKKFFPLSNEKDKLYESPKFYFTSSSWTLRIYPNNPDNESSLAIYLHRNLTFPPINVHCSLIIKTGDGKQFDEFTFEDVYNFPTVSRGKSFIKEQFNRKRSKLTQSDDIIVIAKLKSNKSTAVTGSLFSRLQEMSDNFLDIYQNAKKTDIQFKVDEQIVRAHRIVLETRSPIFSATINHDTRENPRSEVTITDMDKSTLEAILGFMYSGILFNLTEDTALQIYAAAEKYDLKVVKELASQVIIESLSVDSVCNVIKVSESFQDKKIGRLAREYFKENADKILEASAWDTFVKENHNIGVELLATVVKKMFKK